MLNIKTMKPIKTFIFILLAVILISCKEDKDSPEPTKSNKELIIGTWKWNGEYDSNGNKTNSNNESTLIFISGGQLQIINSSGTFYLTWYLSANEDTLHYTDGTDTSTDVLSFKNDNRLMDWKESDGYTLEWIRQ